MGVVSVIIFLLVCFLYGILAGIVIIECSYLDDNTTMDMEFSWLLAIFAPFTVIALGVVCFYYYAQEEDDETCEKRWCKWFQKQVNKVKKL